MMADDTFYDRRVSAPGYGRMQGEVTTHADALLAFKLRETQGYHRISTMELPPKPKKPDAPAPEVEPPQPKPKPAPAHASGDFAADGSIVL